MNRPDGFDKLSTGLSFQIFGVPGEYLTDPDWKFELGFDQSGHLLGYSNGSHVSAKFHGSQEVLGESIVNRLVYQHRRISQSLITKLLS